MPTPRQHGGAATEHIPLTVPGFKGLNTQAAQSILGPEWATELLNAVLDENNRVSCRKGWASQTSTPLPAGAQFVQVAEYRKNDGTVELIGSGDDNVLYRSVDDGANWAVVTGTATVTDANMQFINFNEKIIGWQSGDAPVQYSGTSFSDLTDGGSEPTGNAALGAFGRVWAVNSTGVEVAYSGLLNETDWSSTDSGVLSMENVWPESDTIIALASFNGTLVVFGKNNIIVWTDGRGSATGLDPTQAYVVDVISGIGCIARDSIQNVKGDLWFLSRDGVQSLGRLVQEKSNPLDNLSKNIQDFLLSSVEDPNLNLVDVRSVYSPEDRFYLLSLSRTRTDGGGNDSETGKVFVFDTRGRLEDGAARVMGIWTGLVPRAVVKRRDNDLFIALTDVPGELGLYTGFTDNAGTYPFTYESGWIDITGTQGFLVIPKRIDGIFFLGQDGTVSIKWAFDFSSSFFIRPVTFTGVANFAEWGEAKWGTDEWGGGAALKETKVAGQGTGEFIKLGAQATIAGGVVAVQQLDLFVKIGRLK